MPEPQIRPALDCHNAVRFLISFILTRFVIQSDTIRFNLNTVWPLTYFWGLYWGGGGVTRLAGAPHGANIIVQTREKNKREIWNAVVGMDEKRCDVS